MLEGATHEVTAEAGDAGASDILASAHVEHVADAPDRSLEAVAEAAAAAGKPIRMRVPLQLWDPSKGNGGQYTGWRGQIWKFEVSNADAARRAQQMLEAVFDMVNVAGVEKTTVELLKAKRRLTEK